MLVCLFVSGLFVSLFLGRLVRERLPKEVTLEPRPELLLISTKDPQRSVLGSWRHPKEQEPCISCRHSARTNSFSQQAKEGFSPRENNFPASAMSMD